MMLVTMTYIGNVKYRYFSTKVESKESFGKHGESEVILIVLLTAEKYKTALIHYTYGYIFIPLIKWNHIGRKRSMYSHYRKL